MIEPTVILQKIVIGTSLMCAKLHSSAYSRLARAPNRYWWSAAQLPWPTREHSSIKIICLDFA